MSALFLHQMTAENGTLQLGGREAAECMDNDEEDQVKALTYIHLFVASLSILGAGSVIVYIVYWRTCRSSEVRPLFHLAIADLCLATCWVISALVTERTMSGEMNDFCMYLQAIAEAFHLVTFFLTVNYALNVYVRTKDRQNRSNNLRPLMESAVMVWSLRLVIIFSWLLPIALMVPIVYVQVTNATDNECNTSCLLLLEWPSSTRDQESNWLWENYGMLIFVIALFLSIIALMILYGLSYRVYKQLLSQNVWTDRQREALFNARHRITLYILVFMFCWLPALTIAVTRLVRGDHELPIQENFPLYLIQGVTAPSQGFLNCLVYGWTRKSFRRASSEPTPETVTTPLVKTTYRTYGVASARKTFKRSTVESATPSPTETPSPKPIDS